jgi:hypothetical protein
MEVWNCARDEGRSLEAGRQGQASNHRKLRRSKAVVVSVAEKAGRDPVRCGSKETSASEPLMTCRKRMDDVETGGKSLTRDQSGGWPDCRPGGIRHEGGVTLSQALVRNVGTCRSDAKGGIQAGGPCKDESTDAGHRGGATRSSGEGAVTALERRGCVVQLWTEVNRQREEPHG